MKLSVAFREQARPIIAYWVLLLFAFSMFAFAFVLTARIIDAEDIMILIIFFGVVTVGTALGQIAALFRYGRRWVWWHRIDCFL